MYGTWEDFQADNHRVIAWCLHEIYYQNLKATDDVFDVLRVKFTGGKTATGGYEYIHNLRTTYGDQIDEPTYNVHLHKLRTDAVKRKVLDSYIVQLSRLVYKPSSSISDIAELGSEIETYLKGTADGNRRGFLAMSEVNLLHDEAVKDRSNAGGSFCSTGFQWLDEFLTDGYAAGKVTIAAGRPGMGKSAFVVNSMIRLANKFKNPTGSALFALEMDTVSTLDRMNAIETDIPLKKLIKDRRELTPEELELERSAKRRRAKKNIYICDDVRKSLADVKRELRAVKERYGIKVCFIDLFMKLQKPQGSGGRSTADQYTEMLNEAQRIARELQIHLVLVVQIGRKAEARTDKRPQISDLKDSGAYEEIADNILLFYRDAYYLQKALGNAELKVDIMEIIIGKQRQGETGTLLAKYTGHTTKIGRAREEDIRIFKEQMESLKGEANKNIKRDKSRDKSRPAMGDGNPVLKSKNRGREHE